MDEEIDKLPQEYKNQFNIGFIIGNNDHDLGNLLLNSFEPSKEEIASVNGLSAGLIWGIKEYEKALNLQKQEGDLQELKEIREKENNQREIDHEI